MCSRQPFGAGSKIPPVQCTEGTVLGQYYINWRRGFSRRFCVGKRWETAGILCVLQGFPNEFLAEKIRQNPQTHLRGVALEFQHQTAGERAAVQ